MWLAGIVHFVDETTWGEPWVGVPERDLLFMLVKSLGHVGAPNVFTTENARTAFYFHG